VFDNKYSAVALSDPVIFLVMTNNCALAHENKDRCKGKYMKENKKIGRPRLVQTDELAQIMFTVFADKGYEATSLNDLTEATGLKPASLYQAFKNKEGMFVAAMTHYKKVWLAELDEMLEDSRCAFSSRIKAFLKAAFTVFTCDGKPAGCMLVFSVLSFQPENTSLGQVLAQERQAFRLWLEQEAEKGLSSGQLQSVMNAREIAEFIFTFECGLAIVALDSPDVNVIQQMIDKTIDALFSAPTSSQTEG